MLQFLHLSPDLDVNVLKSKHSVCKFILNFQLEYDVVDTESKNLIFLDRLQIRMPKNKYMNIYKYNIVLNYILIIIYIK